ncbi:MAG: hypothetical protein J6P07_01895 [Spirochaetaceae bacterium]|nr:hypothetical protein [Spirochaetaceae bacterium]MBO7136681.1 hypothetical protein [Spirochaetaceae bacterium]MBO7731907.1 hypothetical protein [Methanobrevibacter sp.]
MSDEELAKIVAEVEGKSDEERDSVLESKNLSEEELGIILETLESLKDYIEEKAETQPAEQTLSAEENTEGEPEKSGADDTLTEDLSKEVEPVDTDGDGDNDAVVVDKEEKHGDEDKPHDKGIKPTNILAALSALRY